MNNYLKYLIFCNLGITDSAAQWLALWTSELEVQLGPGSNPNGLKFFSSFFCYGPHVDHILTNIDEFSIKSYRCTQFCSPDQRGFGEIVEISDVVELLLLLYKF